MSAALNNVTAPDEYSEAATLRCQDTARVRLAVYNQAIYWQRGFGDVGGAIAWTEPEEFMPPRTDSLDERCDAIRVRAAIRAAELPLGAKQAQVTITTRTEAELGE